MNKLSIREFSLFIALVLIWIFFASLNPDFIGARNISKLGVELAMTTIVAFGMLLILLPGQIDLSVGSGAAFLGGIASTLIFNQSLPAPLALGIGLLSGIVIWTCMGLVIVHQKLPAFIITLGGLLIFRGLDHKVIGGTNVPVTGAGQQNLYTMLTESNVPPLIGWILVAVISLLLIVKMIKQRQRRKQYNFDNEDGEMSFLKVFIIIQALILAVIMFNQYQGIPLPVILLSVVGCFVYYVTEHHKLGRYLYAIGSNEEAARLSGIPIERCIVIAFLILGVLTALTGFIQASFVGSSTPQACEYLELDAIAACVIGGTSLKGGRGNVFGVLLGSLIMVSLVKGMTLMGMDPADKLITRGSVLVLAVWLDIYLARRSGIADIH